MKLIIVSQDNKTIVQSNYMFVKGNTIRAKVIEGVEDNTDELGRYQTEQRAIEVMNDMLERQNKLDKANFLGMIETRFVSRVYRMPNE